MACDVLVMPNGGSAIVCGRHRHQRCACGRVATLLCDWKVKSKRSGTCDRPVCARCATSPAAGKDLCPTHHEAFTAWRAGTLPGLAEMNAHMFGRGDL